MPDQSKQIIPDLEDITRCLDQEILEILDSHGLLSIDELLEKLRKPIVSELSTETFNHAYNRSKPVHNLTKDNLLKNLNAAMSKNTAMNLLPSILANGINCDLLQPDQKGWQKGKLKICFEFIPEENISVTAQEKATEDYHSPLDEIRQLSNELASVGSIEQN